MEIYSVPCLVDAKNDYTQKLVRHLKKSFMTNILKLYDLSKENCMNFHEDEKILLCFQDKLSEVVDWDELKKTEFSDDIIASSRCDWLEDLVTAVFILHTKILATIRSKNPPKKVNINVPEIKEFLHQCYIEVCRELWKHAYLFQETSDPCLYQQNYNKCEEIISNSIIETIRDMLPVREMLRDHLSVIEDESSFEEDNSEELFNKDENKDKDKEDSPLPILSTPFKIEETKCENINPINKENFCLINKEKIEEPKKIVDLNKVEENKTDLNNIKELVISEIPCEISQSTKPSDVIDILDLGDDSKFQTVNVNYNNNENNEPTVGFEQC